MAMNHYNIHSNNGHLISLQLYLSQSRMKGIQEKTLGPKGFNSSCLPIKFYLRIVALIEIKYCH